MRLAWTHLWGRLVLLILFGMAAAAPRAIAEGPDPEWEKLSAFLSDIKGVATSPIHDVVVDKFTAGMLLGNGDLGVVVGGTTTTQNFYLSKNDFLGEAFDATRKAWVQSILPIGSMSIEAVTTTTGDGAAVFRMEQDILHAEVRTRMMLGAATVNMRSWTADSHNVFVIELASEPGSPAVDLKINLHETVSAVYPSQSGTENGLLWATRENDSHSGYKTRAALALRLVGAAFESTANEPSRISGAFKLEPGVAVRIAVAVASDGRMGDCAAPDALRAEAVKNALALNDREIIRMSQSHQDWWKQYWMKSYIRVNDPVLEKYYYGSLYMMGSAARPGKLLPSMWGAWVTNDQPRWGGRHFFNYNAQAPYYGVASSNRPELILPYSEFMAAEMPHQINLTRKAGYQGLQFKRSFQPFSVFMPEPEMGPLAPEKDWKKLQTDQKSNASFAAIPMIMYYEYTMDRGFLRDRLYPFLKELDTFWRDYMDRSDLPGGGYRYVVNHSGAHEFANSAAAPDVNPNLDLGFIRTVVRLLIEGSKQLGVDEKMLPVWQDELDHLSAYPTKIINGKECFVNEEARQRIDMRGQPVNMEGAVHPGENVALGGDPKWIQIGLNSLEAMQPWGLGGGSANNGFCKVWPVAARLGWPAQDFMDKFKAAILHLWRESNLTCFQGGGGIETAGSIDAVNAMLLQSNFGELRLFPVWPKDKDASFMRLRAKGAFVVSSSFKGGKVEYIQVLSEKGMPLKILNPWSGGKLSVSALDGGSAVAESSGDTAPRQAVNYEIKDGFIVFPTTGGVTYRIRSFGS